MMNRLHSFIYFFALNFNLRLCMLGAADVVSLHLPLTPGGV
jgi:hypothetical protein